MQRRKLASRVFRVAASQARCQDFTHYVGTGAQPNPNPVWGGSVAEWLACWTQAQKGPGSNRSRDPGGL